MWSITTNYSTFCAARAKRPLNQESKQFIDCSSPAVAFDRAEVRLRTVQLQEILEIVRPHPLATFRGGHTYLRSSPSLSLKKGLKNLRIVPRYIMVNWRGHDALFFNATAVGRGLR